MVQRRKMKRFTTVVIMAITIAALFESCAPTTGATYLRKSSTGEFDNSPDKVFQVPAPVNDTIYIKDELYITVTTSGDESNSFNSGTGGIGGNLDLLAYRVDEDGTLKLPYIQRIYVHGMTIRSATDSIEAQLSQYLYLPTVSIRKVNHRYSVLGEVNAPGLYAFNQKPVNIYQAIATARDISVFGNREKVLVVRQQGNTVVKKYVNLLDDDIISSEWYMVKPDDMIYVEPMARKAFGLETVPYGLILSIFSTTMVTFSFMISILNN